jgi:hypothetical protein
MPDARPRPRETAISDVASALKTFSRLASIVAVFVGCLVLVGWKLDVEVLKGFLAGLETRIRRKNGSIVWVSVNGRAVRNAELEAVRTLHAGGRLQHPLLWRDGARHQ